MHVPAKRCIVVGIGNPLLTDHRVGLEVVEALRACNAEVETATLPGMGVEVMETILGYDRAVIVDACQTGGHPGTVHEMTPDDMIEHPAGSLAWMLRKGRKACPDLMPSDLRIVLVEAEDMSNFSTRCTPAVSHAVDDVVSLIHAAHA